MLLFTLDGVRYALPLAAVQRVVRAAAIVPLPKAPEIVLGVLDLAGQVVPVVDLRRRFGLPGRPIRVTDQMVVARASARTVALVVDGTEGVLPGSAEPPVAPEEIVGGTRHLAGVSRSAEGLVLIHDLATLLFADEEAQLAGALGEPRA